MERTIKQALDESGLPWRMSHGKKHLKIFLDGSLVASLSRGTKAGRKVKMVLSDIKRRTGNFTGNNRVTPR